MKTIKADVRLKKKMDVYVPPSPGITKLTFSPRIHNGQIVFDITMPVEAAIEHVPKPLTVGPEKT